MEWMLSIRIQQIPQLVQLNRLTMDVLFSEITSIPTQSDMIPVQFHQMIVETKKLKHLWKVCATFFITFPKFHSRI